MLNMMPHSYSLENVELNGSRFIAAVHTDNSVIFHAVFFPCRKYLQLLPVYLFIYLFFLEALLLYWWHELIILNNNEENTLFLLCFLPSIEIINITLIFFTRFVNIFLFWKIFNCHVIHPVGFPPCNLNIILSEDHVDFSICTCLYL